MQPLYERLGADEDARRYIVDREILIRTPQGAQIAALAFRPRAIAGSLPTLLNFHIYANDNNGVVEARKTAAYGYCAIVAFSRGKGRSPGAPTRYEYDGDDARAVIDWISRQPWSDGRVGMYGGSYAGFTQWAAAKRLPRALRAMLSASPTYQRRASYAADRTRRRLLEPGKRQSVEFESERLTSRKMLPGSRLVLVLAVPKNQFQQINYGTGKDVSEESIEDAKEPLHIRWFGNSYVDIPIAR